MQYSVDPTRASAEDEVELEGYTFEGTTDPSLPLVELETLLARPSSWRKRCIQIGILLAALAVTLLTCWNTLLPRPPVKPATAASASASVLSIISNVTYGRLTINGRQQSAPLPMQMVLSSTAKLTVTLDAPPFRPVTCSVPPTAPTPSGVFNPCVLRGYAPPQQRPLVVLTILLSLDGLPLVLQQQAITLLSSAATFEEVTIAPGASRVALGIAADGTITNRLTTEPLQASVSVAPVPLTTLQGDPFCDGKFCYMAFPASANRESLWAVSVTVALRWRFTNTAGTVFSEVAYPVLEDWEAYLTYDPASGWQVPGALNAVSDAARQLSRLSCATGVALLQAQVAGRDWTISVAHEAGMQGCRLVSQQAREDQDAFVWRFGVLLAADARAQGILPSLPLARPADSAAIGG